MLKNYSSVNGIYGYYDSNGTFIPIGMDVTVTKAESVLENGELIVTLEFLLSTLKKTVRCGMNDLVKELGKSGYPVANADTKNLYNYIHQQVDNLPAIEYIHKDLGWAVDINGKPYFKGAVGVGVKSEYIGNYDVAVHGSKAGFYQDYHNLIYNHIPLEACIVMGLSACLVGYLAVTAPDICPPTPVYDFNGVTTTGKTTSAKLAVSMGGACEKNGKQSLAGTCSTTVNALYGVLNGNYGYPMLFDEKGRLGAKTDIGSMVYAVSDGTDKARMNSSCKVSPPKTWATAVFFTGESPLLSGVRKADGLLMRIIPFSNVKWTESGAQADAVKEFAAKYSGLPIMEFAKYLYALPSSYVIKRYNAAIATLAPQISLFENLQERMAKLVALITVTAELAEKPLGISFHSKEIQKFVLDNIGGNTPECEAETAFEDIVNKFSQNAGRFTAPPVDNKYRTPIYRDCWGNIRHGVKIQDGEKVTEADLLIITKDIFLSWMDECGYTNVENILREWKNKGIILQQKPDRYYSKVVLQKGCPQINCIRIILNNGDYKDVPPTPEESKFSHIMCEQLIREQYDIYSNAPYGENGMIQAVGKTVENMVNGTFDVELTKEIVDKCFKLKVDFPLIQSYLYGAKHKEWEKNKNKPKPDKRQMTLDSIQKGGDSKNG